MFYIIENVYNCKITPTNFRIFIKILTISLKFYN